MVIVNQAPFAVILLMSTLHVKIVDSMRDEQRYLSRSPSPQRKQHEAQMRDYIQYQLSVRHLRQKVRDTVKKDPCVNDYYPFGPQKEAAHQGCKEAVDAFKSLPTGDKMGCANPGDASCQLIYEYKSDSSVCTVKCDLPIDEQGPGCCLGFCPPVIQAPTPLGKLVSYFDEDSTSLDESARAWGVSRYSSYSNGGSGSPPWGTGSPPRGPGSPPRGTGSPPRGTGSPPRGTGSPPRGNSKRSPPRRHPDRIPTTGEGNIDAQATEYITMHPHPQPNGEPRWSPPKDRPKPERRVTPGESDIDRRAGEFIHHVHDEYDSNGFYVEFNHKDDRKYARVQTDVDKKAGNFIDKVRNNFARQKTASNLRQKSTNIFKGVGKALSLPQWMSKRARPDRSDRGSSYGG